MLISPLFTPHDPERGREMNLGYRRELRLVAVLVAVLAAAGVVLADSDPFRVLTSGELFKEGMQYTESIDMMFDVAQGGALSLGTTNGSVKVNTWSRNQVRLLITKTTQASSPYNARTILEDFLVQTRHEGSNLKLKGVAGSPSCRNAVGVTFEIWVPSEYNVEINTGSGNVDIGKISGSFSAKTGKGKISFECDPEGMDIEVEDRSGGKTTDASLGAEDKPHQPARSSPGRGTGDAATRGWEGRSD